MSHYLIAQIVIHDRETYGQYEAGFMPIFNRYKGKMLSVDENPDVLEGQWSCTRTVLVEFPSKQDALDWYQSDEYQQLAKYHVAYTVVQVVLCSHQF